MGEAVGTAVGAKVVGAAVQLVHIVGELEGEDDGDKVGDEDVGNKVALVGVAVVAEGADPQNAS